MPIDILNFFRPDRLFNLRPAISDNAVYFLFTIFSVLILLGIIFAALKKQSKGTKFYAPTVQLYQKYFVFFLTMGLAGMVLLLFRYERVTVLSARFWLAIWGVVLIGWLGFILRYQYKKIPDLHKQRQRQDEFKKYLPSNHKNKKIKKH